MNIHMKEIVFQETPTIRTKILVSNTVEKLVVSGDHGRGLWSSEGHERRRVIRSTTVRTTCTLCILKIKNGFLAGLYEKVE